VPKISSQFAGVGSILGAAFIEPAICHGCGSCTSECPAQAIQLMHYTDAQVMTKLDSLFLSRNALRDADSSGFVPLESIRINLAENT
jgi:ferredoxin